MTYTQWLQQHGDKHKRIMKKLEHLKPDEAIEYFRFENMAKMEVDFCPLYAKNEKCHDIEILNCYLCACPDFRFKEEGYHEKEGKTIFSMCSISAKEGGQFISEDAIHHDCTKCTLPHSESYIKNVFDRDWFKMMGNVC
jgi:hypothetical protein